MASQRSLLDVRAWKAVRAVHLYAGLALSLLLFVFAITGSALVYKEAYWRLAYPELRGPDPEVTPEDRAAAIAAAHAHFGDELRSVKSPEPGVPAYHLYLADGEAFLSVGDHEVIDRWRPSDRVMSLLFDVHAHLTAGEVGEQVGGVVGLLGVLMIGTGLVLWWPARRRFTMANMLPRGWTRGRLVSWHRDVGVLTSPIVLILLLTAGGLVFYEQAGRMLSGVLGDPAPTIAEPTGSRDAPFALPDPALLAKVGRALPDARIVFYYPPSGGSGVHGFRLKQPCELHPNGRSYVYLDLAGALLAKTDACVLPATDRTMHAVYPLHAGKADSQVYKLATFLGGVALAVLSASGTLAYLRKVRWL